MSETENRIHRVTWRSIPGINRPMGDYGEFLDSHDVTAAYYVREDGMVVFKKANGAITFTVAEPLVETIRIVEESGAYASGGLVTAGQSYVVGGTPGFDVLPREQVAEANSTTVFSLGATVATEAELAAKLRREIQQGRRRNPPEATAC